MSIEGAPELALAAFPRRQNLREQVAHALRAALVAGEMRPGVVYSAPALATQFGVSPTPVREAMLDLAKEGLVEAVRNKGFRVVELTEQDLDEITEIRELIEVPVVGRLAGDQYKQALEQLRGTAQEIVDAAARRDTLAYIDADRRFHLDLLGLAGNGHLVEVIKDLRNRARLYGVSQMAQRGVLVPSAQEHLELLDLLLRGDGRAAEHLMRRHLGHVRGVWSGDLPQHPEGHRGR
jgi:DNA-binding GntR family transcriptional regulator